MDNIRINLYQLMGHVGYGELRIVDYTLDNADLECQCPLDNGQRSAGSWYSVGQLDVLPPEIVTAILLTLDLPTLVAFRRVNRRAMSLVDSLHQYRMLLKHCPNVLRAIVSIRAKHFSCMTLYKVLASTKCDTCHRSGSYLYLITCKRVCYSCFTSHAKYLPMSKPLATKYTGLSRKKLKHIPYILSLPGRYTARGKISNRRTKLFDRQHVLDATPDAPIQSYDGRIQEQDITTREPRRYMSIISAPYFNSSGHLAEWGFHCDNCRSLTRSATNMKNKFTTDGIIDHMKWHEAGTSI
ncbi:hypothetical protein F5Y19DRAFT_26697 [Xylariaceae sp. FL1651]|nr:hypothetical protein F5Y19DRAFT_26697 [Xylariaceae sp. FL1651]